MIYYISDLHFGHRNVIAMDGRPFETIEEMDATLIRLWNERVTAEDMVKQYAVGRFRRADREEIICNAQKLIIELDQ